MEHHLEAALEIEGYKMKGLIQGIAFSALLLVFNGCASIPPEGTTERVQWQAQRDEKRAQGEAALKKGSEFTGKPMPQ